MAHKKWTVKGTVNDTTNGVGAAGVLVEAWDRDYGSDDHLDSATTDVNGAFTITFYENRFQELFGDRRPDIYFDGVPWG